MPSLILEGGTFRPIFSCGVMDALLESEIMFPYCIGVSAGISNGISYISKQKGRNLEIIEKYRNDKRYIGKSNIKKCKSVFGLDFVFGDIPNKLIPFDMQTYLKYDGKVLVGLTNANTGLAEYIDGKLVDHKYMMFRATCAIPIFFPPVQLGGRKYYDGGVSDPIPVKKAIKDGNEKHLIVLTRPKGYEKKLGKSNIVTARLLKKKYPKMQNILLSRHTIYNETVQYCEKLEQEGKAIILRPEQPINSMEKDITTLKRIYQEGYELAMNRINEIKGLF